MKILKVEVGKEPYEKEIAHDLESIQREVEGLFEPVYLESKVVLCCNEEGKINGMKPNRRVGRDIICGPFFLAGIDREGERSSLSEEKLKEYSKLFHEPEQFSGNEPELEPRMSFYLM